MVVKKQLSELDVSDDKIVHPLICSEIMFQAPESLTMYYIELQVNKIVANLLEQGDTKTKDDVINSYLNIFKNYGN